MRISVSRIIDAPAATAWRILTDTRCWPAWGPSVRAVECPDRYIQPGSKGRILTAIGLWAPFEITAFEEGRCWSWRVYGMAATGHRVEPLGSDRCRVIFEVPAWAAPYGLVCKLALQRIATIADRERRR